ncbi:MAG: SDR family NAD(P)-dependent oxidoreductase [Novosphingobium sp.]|nr:SDR family NAD(P)-dependent oxidoreductase [Novosphingobium sp.]
MAFKDMVSVITGGAGGIGLALARAVVTRGGAVALADLSREKAQAAAEEFSGHVRAYRCDVSDRADVEALAADVLADFGAVDLVFANAGVAVGGPLTETDPREFDWMFDVNVRGTFNTISVFAPVLRARAATGRPARFILTGSENSVGLPTTAVMTAYTATKHAVLAMADGLRRDLADSGVGVTVFCPGLVNTRIWDSRANRQDRYGGAEAWPAEQAAQMSRQVAAHGQDPDAMAALVFAGMERDEVLVITDPKIRFFAETRGALVADALDVLDARLASEAGGAPAV